MTTPTHPDPMAGKLLACAAELRHGWMPGACPTIVETVAGQLEALASSEPGELAGWQKRYIDPEEGPSLWTACTLGEYEFLQSPHYAGMYETRKLYTHPAPEQPGKGEACDCPAKGKQNPILHAPNCPVRIEADQSATDAQWKTWADTLRKLIGDRSEVLHLAADVQAEGDGVRFSNTRFVRTPQPSDPIQAAVAEAEANGADPYLAGISAKNALISQPSDPAEGDALLDEVMSWLPYDGDHKNIRDRFAKFCAALSTPPPAISDGQGVDPDTWFMTWFNAYPNDIRKKLSLHDLKRMYDAIAALHPAAQRGEKS